VLLEILLCHVAANVYRCRGLDLRPDKETTSTPEDAIILIVVCLIIATVLKELICTSYIPQMQNLNDNMEVWSVLKFFQQQCLRQTICWALNLVTNTAFTNELCTEFHATGPLWSKSLKCSCSGSRHNVYASFYFFLVYSSILSSVSTCQLGRSLLSLSLSLSKSRRVWIAICKSTDAYEDYKARRRRRNQDQLAYLTDKPQ
jgi:hypothetical protein